MKTAFLCNGKDADSSEGTGTTGKLAKDETLYSFEARWSDDRVPADLVLDHIKEHGHPNTEAVKAKDGFLLVKVRNRIAKNQDEINSISNDVLIAVQMVSLQETGGFLDQVSVKRAK